MKLSSFFSFGHFVSTHLWVDSESPILFLPIRTISFVFFSFQNQLEFWCFSEHETIIFLSLLSISCQLQLKSPLFFNRHIFSSKYFFFLISAHKDCPQCDESFFGMNAKRSLDRHMKTHNKVTKGKIMTEKNYVQGKLSNCFFFPAAYVCQKCDRVFEGSQAKRNYVLHMSKCGKPIEEYKCHFCNFVYKTKSSLRQHKKKYCREDLK